MQKNISAVLRSVTKIYVGQLVEESKRIQMEELQKQGVDVTQEVDLTPIQPY